MNREEYQKVKQIFQSALDIAPAGRSRYLDDKCSGNPRLYLPITRGQITPLLANVSHQQWGTSASQTY